MSLRFMKLVSTGEERDCQRRRRIAARRQARPEQVERSFDPGMEGRVTVERPNQKSAENCLAKNVSDLRSRKVITDFAAILAELNHLGVQAMHPFLQIHHGLANRSRRKIGLKKRSDYGRVASRLLGHADAQRTEELWHRLVYLAGRLDGCFQLPELHLHEGQ